MPKIADSMNDNIIVWCLKLKIKSSKNLKFDFLSQKDGQDERHFLWSIFKVHFIWTTLNCMINILHPWNCLV